MPGLYATASTSTSSRGSISAATWIMLVAGRTSPNAARWASPISGQREMSVTNIRVRTTSGRPAPSRSSAAPMFAIAWVVCSLASPSCTTSPCRTDVLPVTKMKSPAATALL